MAWTGDDGDRWWRATTSPGAQAARCTTRRWRSRGTRAACARATRCCSGSRGRRTGPLSTTQAGSSKSAPRPCGTSDAPAPPGPTRGSGSWKPPGSIPCPAPPAGSPVPSPSRATASPGPRPPAGPERCGPSRPWSPRGPRRLTGTRSRSGRSAPGPGAPEPGGSIRRIQRTAEEVTARGCFRAPWSDEARRERILDPPKEVQERTLTQRRERSHGGGIGM